jgi:glycerol uptake facilitator protein
LQYLRRHTLKPLNKFIDKLSLDQIIGTMILVLAILAVTDSRNKVGAGIAPPIISMSISAVGLSFGYNCGFSLNPARDLGF